MLLITEITKSFPDKESVEALNREAFLKEEWKDVGTFMLFDCRA